MELLIVLVGSTLLLGYAMYVWTLVVEADFYSRAQKIAQGLLVFVLPLVGAAVVHWFYLAHRAPPAKPDRAFIPQREPPPEDLRGPSREIEDT
jgi:hypothetical protein